jgi:hypothetical protein
MCDRCRKDLCGPLLKQIDVFSEAVRKVNPKAEFQVSLWPIWFWEDKLKARYGNELLDRLKRKWPGDRLLPSIVDDCTETPANFLKAAAERGFRTHAFIFPTNIETSFVFLNPLLDYGQWAAKEAVGKKLKSLFCHRLEAGSKSANTFFNGEWFWQPQVTPKEVVTRYSRWLCGDKAAADHLTTALLRWNKTLYEGNDAAAWPMIRKELAAAVAATPLSLADRLAPLVDAADCLAVVSEGVTATATEQTRLADRLREVMSKTTTFRDYASRAPAEYPTYVRWLRDGWRKERF